jgi:tetratricopeptide (TPR) repeat protein
VAKQKRWGLAMATRALAAARAGRHSESEEQARRALAAEPNNPSVLFALGELAFEQGDAARASALFEQAIERRPSPVPASWHLSLGQALVRTGKLDEGTRSLEAAVAVDAANVGAWLGLARARHVLGDLRAAVRAWEKAVALNPGAWEPFNDLGSAWMEMREWDRAANAFAQSERLSPGEPIVAVNRATLDLRQGRVREAVAALEAAAAQQPGYAPAIAGLGFALRDAGCYAEAVAALRRATELSPDKTTYVCGLGRALLESGAADESLATATALLKRKPGHSGARALETLARIGLGDVEGVTRLLDYSRFLGVTKLAAPPGFADLAAFDAALASHAAAHPTLLSSPISHATLDGMHSGSLLVEPRGPVALLEQAVGVALSAYWRARSEIDHPAFQSRPRAVYLKMWTVVLQQGGRQIPHIHPESWLSGVYYPQLPESMRNGPGPGGWLEFGEADRPFPARMAAPTHRVRPEEGLLVIFPSYFYHRTVPFEGAGTRISIAFDVMGL